MPKYEYEAVDPANRKRHKGVIEAPSTEKAIQMLLARKIFPAYLSEMTATQVAVANRIANFKKLTRSQEPQPIPVEDLITPPKRKKFDWTYIIILAAMAAVLAAWALSSR